jgi:predicted lipid carrier protein YhbT
MKQKYIAVGNKWIPVNEAAADKEYGVMIQGPLKPFISMLDGKEVTSRLQYQADLKAHGYVEVGNEVSHLMKHSTIPDVDPQHRRELIAAQIRELGYEGTKKALKRDIDFVKWNSRGIK